MTDMELSRIDFERFQALVFHLCGVVVPNGKEYLIKQRLQPVVRKLGYGSFGEFYEHLSQDYSQKLHDRVIEAITTNETYFFRDVHPFDTFRDVVLPQLGRLIKERKERPSLRKGPKVSIWSAASSTGQEAYSVAMLVYDFARANTFSGIACEDFEIMSTDISSEVLARAISGEYTELEVSRGLPESFRNRFFRKMGNVWVLEDSIRTMVEFRKLNLLESFQFLHGFDVVFCRNVLIYFDERAKKDIIGRFYNLLSDDGWLILGASENIYSISDQFESVRHGATIMYRKKK